MLYFGYLLLRYVLIYNLEVSFHFHLTFLQLNVIKMFTVHKSCFLPYSRAIFFELPITRNPDNSNLFSISLEDSSYRESTVLLIKIQSRLESRGVLPKMTYTERLHRKGIPFSGFKYMRGLRFHLLEYMKGYCRFGW